MSIPLDRRHCPNLVATRAWLRVTPLETWTRALERDVEPSRLVVRIGRTRLVYVGDPKALELSRPVESPAFDWESAVGLHQKGRELMRQRMYAEARPALEAALAKDPTLLPALTDLAQLRYLAMDDQGAFDLARRALAIDTYDPAANYYYGLASARLGRRADARDGFEIAAQSDAEGENARRYRPLSHWLRGVEGQGQQPVA